jgi:hypothetical protein
MATKEEEQLIIGTSGKASADPSFWIHHTHVRMREAVELLVSEIERLAPDERGTLPSVARDLVHVLDDFTKLAKRGFAMQPPGGSPPIAGGPVTADNDPMEDRVAKLEAGMEFVQRELTELKTDVREVRSDLKGIRTDMNTDFRVLFGALIAIAVGLAGIMAKGFHWL